MRSLPANDEWTAPVLLDNKTAIVYGAAGAIGSAVAHAYAMLTFADGLVVSERVYSDQLELLT